MKSVVYVEEDFVAGLLREYFAGNGDTATLVRRGTNGLLADRLSRSQVDLFLAQSEDVERLSKILELVRQQGRKTPTLVLTSQSEEIPDQYKLFAHFVSISELLETNLRWHIRLAMTMRRVEEVREELRGRPLLGGESIARHVADRLARRSRRPSCTPPASNMRANTR